MERPQQREGILAQEAQGQTVLLRLEDGSYYAVDEVGARIWELCDGQRSFADIVAVMRDEFEAPADQISADVAEFIAELRTEQLLVEVE
jgi:coenzyme PQQ biosynthesis protein PqqD